MTFTRRSLLAAATAATLAPTLAQAAETALSLSSEALLGDAEIVRQAYGAMHPGLLRYNSPARMAGHFADLQRTFSKPRSQAEAFLALARLTSRVRCGHTYPNPFNQTKAVRAGLLGGRTRLPFRFTWINGRMVVLKDLSGDPGLRTGTVIEAVNGMDTGAMLAGLMPLTRADGHNDARRVRNLDVRGDGTWEDFDVYAPLLWPGLKDTALLRVRSPGGATRRVEVGLQTAQERAAQRADIEHGDAPAWTLERLPGGGGWLTMPSWALYDSKWDWKSWLDQTFDTLVSERAPGLVIDLRGNGGGLDVGEAILRRLIDRDLRPVADVRRVRYRRAPANLQPYLDTWDPAFKDWGEAAVGPDAQGFYRLTKYDDDDRGDVIRPKGPRYTGRVVVLIDASNASATFQFANALKDHGLATLVGQTNGGNRRGINGGAFFFLKLPGSGLEVDLPLIGRFPVTPQPDAGIAPDVFIRPSAADIAAGYDPGRAAALKLVAG